MAELTDEELILLKQYVSNPGGDVFVVSNLPGMVGAVMARLSRARGGFPDIFLREFIREGQLDPVRARKLMDKVLIAYGDDSVGELEGAHLYLGRISNLATKLVEDSRIGLAYIEQSSRYVVYDEKDPDGRYRFYREPAIMATSDGALYEAVLTRCFEAYSRVVQALKEFLRKLKPIDEAEYDIRGKGRERLADLTDPEDIKAFRQTYNSDLQTKACDTARVLLPAATLTNVGLFGNGRAFEHMLTRLYSSDLIEMTNLAAAAHRELDTVIPLFVKRAQRDPYLVGIQRAMEEIAGEFIRGVKPWEPRGEVTLLTVGEGEDFDLYMIAAMLFPYAEHPFLQLLGLVRLLPKDDQERIANAYLGARAHRRQRPGRALEWGYPLTYEIVGNFGIYRDLHRHRILLHMRQLLSTRLGFDMPELIEEAGLANEVARCRDEVADLYERFLTNFGPEIAQYVVLFGFRLRWLMGMNDREAMHLLELRTIKQGHPDYRRICQKMQRLAEAQSPLRARMRHYVDFNEYFWSRAESEASQRRKERRLGLKAEGEE